MADDEFREIANAAARKFEGLTQALDDLVGDLLAKERRSSTAELRRIAKATRARSTGGETLQEILTGAPAEPMTPKMELLSLNRSDIAWYRGELLRDFNKIEDSGLRFDIIHFVSELVEEAFSLAAKTGLTKEDLESAKREASRKFGAEGGKKSAPGRRRNAESWRQPLEQHYGSLRKKHPAQFTNRLAGQAYELLTNPPIGADTAIKHIQDEVRAGRLAGPEKKEL